MVQTLCVVVAILLAVSAVGALLAWALGRVRPDAWGVEEGKSSWWM